MQVFDPQQKQLIQWSFNITVNILQSTNKGYTQSSASKVRDLGCLLISSNSALIPMFVIGLLYAIHVHLGLEAVETIKILNLNFVPCHIELC